MVGDDVFLGAAVHHAGRHDERVLRVVDAADDRLEREHRRGRREDRVVAEVRSTAVRQNAVDLDRKPVAARHARAALAVELAGRDRAPDVGAIDRVDAFERAALYVLLREAADLFRHLEDQLHGAAERVKVVIDDARRAEQHRRVAVMAAGVHDAVVHAAERHDVRILLDRQRVNVRAEHDSLAGVLPVALAGAVEGRDAARNVVVSCDLAVVKLFQLRDDKLRGLHFLQGELRVLVQMAAAADDVFFLLFRQCLEIDHAWPPFCAAPAGFFFAR